jgi:hypothetical protein
MSKLFCFLIKQFAKILPTIIFLSILVGCGESEKRPPQERYKQAFAVSVCMAMDIHVEAYKKDPFENQWGMQGITSIEKRDHHVIALGKIGMKSLMHSYRVPRDYIPSPENYSLQEISSFCEKTYLKFLQIPF